MTDFNFVENTFMVPYTKEVSDYCDPFSCRDDDLDEFFSHDVFLYEEELLGKRGDRRGERGERRGERVVDLKLYL